MFKRSHFAKLKDIKKKRKKKKNNEIFIVETNLSYLEIIENVILAVCSIFC